MTPQQSAEYRIVYNIFFSTVIPGVTRNPENLCWIPDEVYSRLEGGSRNDAMMKPYSKLQGMLKFKGISN